MVAVETPAVLRSSLTFGAGLTILLTMTLYNITKLRVDEIDYTTFMFLVIADSVVIEYSSTVMFCIIWCVFKVNHYVLTRVYM